MTSATGVTTVDAMAAIVEATGSLTTIVMSGLAGTAPHLMTTTAPTLPTLPTLPTPPLIHHSLQATCLDTIMTSATSATMVDATAAIVEATGSTMMNATIIYAGTKPTPIILPAMKMLPAIPAESTTPPINHLVTLVTKMISMTGATTTDAKEAVSSTGFTTTIAMSGPAGMAPHMLIPPTTTLLVPPTTPLLVPPTTPLLVPPTTTHTALKTDTAITP